ncbi:MAG TPA: Rossmann fold nucleotide-binding protein [Marmoricola sp.]|nr:Rossmann fold nucleotide-binding protein [Marmoricola sp.]
MGPIEIETLAEFDDRVAAGASRMDGWQLQDLDLTGREDVLARLDPRGALFLGCRMSRVAEDRLRAGGALLFPTVPDVPFDPWRARLYTAEELYTGLDGSYEVTLDARVYAWSRSRGPRTSLHDMLAQAVHDNSVDDALHEYVRGRRIVGVMGGHELPRDDPAYLDTARLGRALGRAGFTVATGGGPGAMEAANLGAMMARETDGRLETVVGRAARVPSYRPSVSAWANAAFDAVRDVPRSGLSLGIPTWFYGHEPPNPFCAAIAKYFRNAIREDVLLHLSRGGIVFLPGAAGTVQEIFQAACENYYADPGQVAPMVLVGKDYWSTRLPAWELLDVLGAGRPLGAQLHLVDDTEDVLPALLQEG